MGAYFWVGAYFSRYGRFHSMIQSFEFIFDAKVFKNCENFTDNFMLTLPVRKLGWMATARSVSQSPVSRWTGTTFPFNEEKWPR